jgi:hypothetical protein
LQIISNPAMNYDTRNQGLVGMSDGIPMFRSKDSRSVIPLMLRTVNLEDSLSMKFRYTHLVGLVPSHFWILNWKGDRFQRVEKKASHLCALMHAVVDDLLLWEDGAPMEDHSKSPDDPERWFQLRTMLLYWCGDYPGQGEASGFGHSAMSRKACHWCKARGVYCEGIKRQKYGDYYRFIHTIC